MNNDTMAPNRSAVSLLQATGVQDIRHFTERRRYRFQNHFTEELDFLSEDDKDWVMGRAILARLNWA